MGDFAARLDQTSEALEVLSLYPRGISVHQLAETLRLQEFDIRGNLAHFDEAQELPIDSNPRAAAAIWFSDELLPADWRDLSDDAQGLWLDEHIQPPDIAAVVMLSDPDDEPDTFRMRLGVRELATLFDYAQTLLGSEPDNDDLREAVNTLRLRWYPGTTLTREQLLGPPATDTPLAVFRRAIAQRRRVSMQYARKWRPGASTRVVEPYQLVRTQQGYELDAGPVQDNGKIRSFLLRNVVAAQLLDEEFERPGDVAELIAANRDTRTVDVLVQKGGPQLYESLALHHVIIEEDDEPAGERLLRVTLQQPFAQRMAAFLLRAGPLAFVVSDDPDLCDSAANLATDLLRHHGLLTGAQPGTAPGSDTADDARYGDLTG